MNSSPMAISKTTARRFVLGRQDLWPGRRWVEHIQIAAINPPQLQREIHTALKKKLEVQIAAASD